MDMSAALALRHSGLPYYPVQAGTERPAPQMVRLELPPNENRKRVEKVPAIPATLTFLDENGMPEDGREPVRFQAKFAADADNVLEMSIIHTGDLKTGEDELADLLFDAYRNGSIDEAEIQGWDSLQYQLKQLRNSMGHVAAAVLKGPEQAMEDLMETAPGQFPRRAHIMAGPTAGGNGQPGKGDTQDELRAGPGRAAGNEREEKLGETQT